MRRLWTLFATSLVIGIANALNAPAFQASIPLLVQRPDLPGAVSLNSVMINASRVLGPALAAVLALAGFSTSQLFLVNAVTYLFLIAALFAVRVPDVRGSHPEQGWRRLLTGINIARRRPVLARTLITMCVFSVVCLVYVGLFPSVVRRNVGIDVDSTGYKLLYTTWGVGACLGALAVGTVLAGVDRRRLVVDGMLLFAVSLGAFALVRSLGPAFPVAFVLGFAYFLTATSLITIFQENLADTERAVVMPLWFMAFGGSVPIGNLLFGPVIDAIGARWVLGLGALVRRRTLLVERSPPARHGGHRDRQAGGEPFQPSKPRRLDEHDDARHHLTDRGHRVRRRLDPVAVGADRDELDPELTGPRGDGEVSGTGLVELGHLTEHGDAAVGGHRRQRVEGREHRRRVGVVGVVDHDAAGIDGHHLHPHRRQLGPAQPLGGQPEVGADDVRRRRVPPPRSTPCAHRARRGGRARRPRGYAR